MNYQVQIENFTGPFDLLLHLIEEEEVDIYSVSISHITDNYLGYLDKMRENKLDIGGEFLLMATTLLELKSRLLLPAESIDDEEIDLEYDRRSLLDQLVEYKKFKGLANNLEEYSNTFQNVHYRDDVINQYIKEHNIKPKVEITGADISRLVRAFEDVWKSRLLEDIEEKEITQEKITVRDKINYILDELGSKRYLTFSGLFTENVTRVEIIVSFLAVLEIVKRQLVYIFQESAFDDIKIERSWGAATPLKIEEGQTYE
ncbi:MAG: segregation/condensation protein A [Candidatus Margulisiibacteriota bacterium]